MISYHPVKGEPAYFYHAGFLVADTNDVSRLAKCASMFSWSPCVWKNGRRISSGFVLADWVGLDFDDGQMTLDQALRSFSDMIHIIGTTKSHMLPKGEKPPCDRFRVILKLTERCTDTAIYGATMTHLIANYAIDVATRDPARFFWPCTRIVSVSDEGYTQDLVSAPTVDVARENARRHFAKTQYQRFKKLPPWLSDFIEKGKVCRVGRNQTVYAAAVELGNLGFSEADALTLIEKAPIDRRGFADVELKRTVKSGFRRNVAHG